jgi:hypothetical protein
MATGCWGQYAANPTRQPYAGYLSLPRVAWRTKMLSPSAFSAVC